MCTMALRLIAYVATMTSNVPDTNDFREARSFVGDCHVEKTNKKHQECVNKNFTVGRISGQTIL